MAGAPRAHAQPTAPALPLDDVIRQALAGNAGLRGAKAGVDETSAHVDAARAARFPRVSVSESWQRGDQPVFVFSTLLASRRFAATNFAIDQLNHPDALGAFHATTAIEQLLFDGGTRRATVDAARAQQRMADSGVREAAQAIAAAVSDAYGQLLSAQSLRRAARGALDAGREDLARATRRRDTGLATEADVLALAVHVADMEQRVIQADGQAAVARAQINRMSGAPIDRVFEALEPDAAADAPLAPLTDLLTEAEAGRPELARAAAARDAANAMRRGAASAFLPKVAAQAALDITGTRLTDRASAWLVGGEVRWSLALAGAERAQLRAAAAAVARASAEADDARQQVAADVVAATERLRSAQARQAVGRAAVEQARESQRIVRDRYEAGLAPVNDVLRAAAALLDADAQRTAALVDALTARAHLNRALGRTP